MWLQTSYTKLSHRVVILRSTSLSHESHGFILILDRNIVARQKLGDNTRGQLACDDLINQVVFVLDGKTLQIINRLNDIHINIRLLLGLHCHQLMAIWGRELSQRRKQTHAIDVHQRSRVTKQCLILH